MKRFAVPYCTGMETPYRLHYAPDNASLIIRLTLDALQQPFETVLVDRATQGQTAPEYLALNPNGLIPTLETPDGPIFETGAVLLWLADRHGALAPKPKDPSRAAFLKWLFFVSNTLHSGMRMLFYPDKYAGPGHSAQNAMQTRMKTELARHLRVLDRVAGAGQPWFNGVEPTVLDYYVVPCLRWMTLYPKNMKQRDFDLSSFPQLLALACRLEQRPEALAAIRAEGLGPTPFSAPSYASPLEGSAT